MTVQVARLRKYRTVTAVQILPNGMQAPRARPLAIQFSSGVFSEVREGTMWEVDGTPEIRRFEIDGYRYEEDFFETNVAIFKRMSGEILAYYLAKQADGVGPVIARRVARFDGIEELIRTKDVGGLCEIQGVDFGRAQAIMDAWPDADLMDAIVWVQEANIPPVFGRRMVETFGPKAIWHVKRNPFLVLALGSAWKQAITFAESLGFGMDRPEALCAFAEEAARRATQRTGDIAIEKDELVRTACRVSQGALKPAAMIDMAIKRRALVAVGDKGYVVYGAALIEMSLAKILVGWMTRTPGSGAEAASWERLLSDEKIRRALAKFEDGLTFSLTTEQREAVVGVVRNPVSCLSGGAGTGKTTILQAVLGVYAEVAIGLSLKQVALSGRAAQRMAESTGQEATTIAKFISEHVGESKGPMPEQLLLVIDEASMVDVISMYRLCGLLPKATRLIFVGDVAQLPPVGPGLVFHSLMKPESPMPTFVLSQVKRQSEESGIHRFATGVRNGEEVDLPTTRKRVLSGPDATRECEKTVDRVYDLWEQAGGYKQCVILSPVRKGELGVVNLNRQFQKRVGVRRRLVKDPRLPGIEWRSERNEWFFERDPVMVNKNDYALDIRNGELGVISEAFDEPNEDGAVGVVTLDSGSVLLTEEMLSKLQLAYAITVHKSQGSQWPTVIVTLPPEARRMTDRSLLYTSATRPTERLVIVGDLKDIQEAVNRGNVASARKVCLGGLISQRVAAIPHPDPASGSCSDERSCLPDAKQVREKGARPDCDSPNAVEADDFTQNYTRS